jgi:hypothetical protein
MMMEAMHSSEMLVLAYWTTIQCHNQDKNTNLHHHKILTFYTASVIY